ncbi:ACP S-malonyltransferase [Streptomyces sp. NPDC002644]
MASALVFPGLGGQHRGMGASLFARYPTMVEQADEVLGYSLRTLCAGDSRRPLTRLLYAQPAIFAVNAMAGRRWTEERGSNPDCALGYSLGELNALFAAGVLSFREGLSLVVERARATDAIADGGMAVVVGLTPDEVRECLSWRFLEGLDIAAVNSQREVVLAGPRVQLGIAAAALQTARAVQVVPLDVSVPFHSRYMSEAAAHMTRILASITLRKPIFPVIANRTARPHRTGSLSAHLAAQLTESVLWYDSLGYIVQHYPHCTFHEVGRSGMLTAAVGNERLAPHDAPLITPVRWQ